MCNSLIYLSYQIDASLLVLYQQYIQPETLDSHIYNRAVRSAFILYAPYTHHYSETCAYTSGMRWRTLRALSAFILFYLVFGVYLTLNQERIVYQPWPQDFADCPAMAEATQVIYQGTRMYVRKTDGPVVVFYHGNAGSACDRSWLADVFTAAGYDYVLVEYAGYSNDPVPPSHERIATDVHNVIDYLVTQKLTSVALIGESIGAGVASYHANLAPPERLLLISPFPDLRSVAATRFWFYPTWLLVDNAYQPATDLAGYQGPTTIIHGTNDRIIPFRLGEALHLSLPGTKTLVPVEGAGHNNLFSYTETHHTLSTFLLQPNNVR